MKEDGKMWFDPAEEQLFKRFKEAVKCVKIKDGACDYLAMKRVQKAWHDFISAYCEI